MNLKLEAQEDMIQTLLATQTSFPRGQSWISSVSVVDHSAQREPQLVKMSCEQVEIHTTEQHPEVANNKDFEEMLNWEQTETKRMRTTKALKN